VVAILSNPTGKQANGHPPQQQQQQKQLFCWNLLFMLEPKWRQESSSNLVEKGGEI
jgi:hypothetical protein